MCDDMINTNSVGPSETTQQEQKTSNAIHNEQVKKEQAKQEKAEQEAKEKAEKERLRKKVEDDINSGRADTC